MTLRGLRLAVLIGLGMFAEAVLPAPAAAQAPVKRDTLAGRRDTLRTRRDTLPSRGDTTRAPRVTTQRADTILVPLPAHADSMIRNDSIAQGILGEKERRTVDTLKAPLARAEAPPVLDIGMARVYDRSAIFATGALTLSDLLGRVPGLTTFATGWLLAPTGVASQGDFRHVRIFLDGLELDPMNQREQGRAPVNDLPLQSLEELRIERGADEVRVYARSWRVSSTTPYTRADVLTGDQNTNLYRGYFGRRYDHGEAFQVSAEQASTQPNSALPSSDQQSYLLRFGIAKGPWSADVMGLRTQMDRGRWTGAGASFQTRDTISALTTRRTTAYLRLANGDVDSPRWAQFIASSQGFIGTAASVGADTLNSHDSTTYENQYLFTGGLRRGPLRISAAERVRVWQREHAATPSARAAFETAPLSVSLFAEGASPFAPTRFEATARASLRDRLALTGSAARTGSGIFRRVLAQGADSTTFNLTGVFSGVPLGPIGFNDSLSAPRYQLAAQTSLRAEAGVRLRDVWLTVGTLRRGAATLLPAAGLDSVYGRAPAIRVEDAATAATTSLRGRLWRAVNVDAWALAWNDSTGLYRPKYQTRAELYIQTNLLERFPRGNFGLLTSLAHEYRSNSRFATTGNTVRTALGYRTLDFKLEIRIQSAVVSYQFRNLLQENYAQVPGFFLPRQTQFYGVRWDFWN